MRRLAATASILAAFVAAAAQQPAGDNRAAVIAPFVDDQTFAVAHVDLTRLDIDAAIAPWKEIIKSGGGDPENGTPQARQWLSDFRKTGGKDLYLVFGLADLTAVEPPGFAVLPLAAGADAQALVRLLGVGGPAENRPAALRSLTSATVSGALLIGPQAALNRVTSLKPAARPELATAFAAAGQGLISVAVIPSADLRRALTETLPPLPKELGEGRLTAFTKIRWAGLGLDLAPRLGARLTIQADSARAAGEMRDLWNKFWALAAQQARGSDMSKIVQAISAFHPQVEGDRVQLAVEGDNATRTVVVLVEDVFTARRRMLNASNLRQLAIAMHNYHSDFNKLPPPAIYSKDGKPLLSWRVAILPYIEQDALYKQFKLDEPWDSEHNRPLIAKIPFVYRHPDARPADPTHTFYKVFYSRAGSKPSAMLEENGKVSLGQITVQDGTSNTLLLADAGAAVPWTKPEDILFDPSAPLPNLAGPTDKGTFTAAFGDGSVRRINARAKPEVLRALITRNGGEVLDMEEAFDTGSEQQRQFRPGR